MSFLQRSQRLIAYGGCHPHQVRRVRMRTQPMTVAVHDPGHDAGGRRVAGSIGQRSIGVAGRLTIGQSTIVDG